MFVPFGALPNLKSLAVSSYSHLNWNAFTVEELAHYRSHFPGALFVNLVLNGATPLSQALQGEAWDVGRCRELLKLGADANQEIPTPSGAIVRPLCSCSTVAALKFMLEEGKASINFNLRFRGMGSKLPFLAHILLDYCSLQRELFESPPELPKECFGEDFLLLCFSWLRKHKETSQTLEQNLGYLLGDEWFPFVISDINSTDSDGFSVLHYVASLPGSAAAFPIFRLLELGADSSLLNSNGSTPLEVGIAAASAKRNGATLPDPRLHLLDPQVFPFIVNDRELINDLYLIDSDYLTLGMIASVDNIGERNLADFCRYAPSIQNICKLLDRTSSTQNAFNHLIYYCLERPGLTCDDIVALMQSGATVSPGVLLNLYLEFGNEEVLRKIIPPLRYNGWTYTALKRPVSRFSIEVLGAVIEGICRSNLDGYNSREILLTEERSLLVELIGKCFADERARRSGPDSPVDVTHSQIVKKAVQDLLVIYPTHSKWKELRDIFSPQIDSSWTISILHEFVAQIKHIE